jgi:hypothetical protein
MEGHVIPSLSIYISFLSSFSKVSFILYIYFYWLIKALSESRGPLSWSSYIKNPFLTVFKLLKMSFNSIIPVVRPIVRAPSFTGEQV